MPYLIKMLEGNCQFCGERVWFPPITGSDPNHSECKNSQKQGQTEALNSPNPTEGENLDGKEIADTEV